MVAASLVALEALALLVLGVLELAWNFRDVWTFVLPLSLAVVALVVVAGLLHPATTQVLEEDARA